MQDLDIRVKNCHSVRVLCCGPITYSVKSRGRSSAWNMTQDLREGWHPPLVEPWVRRRIPVITKREGLGDSQWKYYQEKLNSLIYENLFRQEYPVIMGEAFADSEKDQRPPLDVSPE